MRQKVEETPLFETKGGGCVFACGLDGGLDEHDPSCPHVSSPSLTRHEYISSISRVYLEYICLSLSRTQSISLTLSLNLSLNLSLTLSLTLSLNFPPA